MSILYVCCNENLFNIIKEQKLNEEKKDKDQASYQASTMQKKHNGRKANLRDGDPNIQIPKADGISYILYVFML